VVTPATGEVVLVPFPFSDLSQTKVRPAVSLAAAGRGDWVLCQITSSAYGDPAAIPLDTPDFATGGLRPHPGRIRAGVVRSNCDPPASRESLTRTSGCSGPATRLSLVVVQRLSRVSRPLNWVVSGKHNVANTPTILCDGAER
jgi:mRNA interferase MazF